VLGLLWVFFLYVVYVVYVANFWVWVCWEFCDFLFCMLFMLFMLQILDLGNVHDIFPRSGESAWIWGECVDLRRVRGSGEVSLFNWQVPRCFGLCCVRGAGAAS
jgi:hypothetical protein